MRCPKCNSDDFQLCAPCEQCQFAGDALALEQYANLSFLLTEMATWAHLSVAVRDLRERYEKQRRRVEVELGLREPLTAVAAAELSAEIANWRAVITAVARWQRSGWINKTTADQTILDAYSHIEALQEQLLDSSPTPPPTNSQAQALQQLAQKRFILKIATNLFNLKLMYPYAYQVVKNLMTTEMEALEIEAGLVERPEANSSLPSPSPAYAKEKSPDDLDAAVAPAPGRFRRPALTWDRVWETLLSERTLQAVLFLGVILLFAAGISWVAWNWGTFPAAVQIAFLSGFTAVFYTLGWYVHQRMQLHGSGIALIAVGSLLVPLDFYAFCLSGGFPPASWPYIWLVASAVCLVAYLVTAVLLQAPFFGYLIGLAVGSLLVATLNLIGIGQAWWQMGVMATAVTLALSGEWLHRKQGRWHFLARPFGQMALALTAPTLLVGWGWSYFRSVSVAFHTALALNWWLGGLVFVLLLRRARLRTLAWATAFVFPVAVWLTARVLFIPRGIMPAWAAVGWALLLPAYLLLARRWLRQEQMAVYGRIFLRSAVILLVVTAVWSLQAVQTAAVTHLLLAGVMAGTAVFWPQPRAFYGMSLFLLTASATWQGGRGATPAELILPWAFWGVLHMVAGLRLGHWDIRILRYWKPSISQYPHISISDYTAPLFTAGYAFAALSILPPLLLNDRPLFSYALLNWIGVNVWLAYLAQTETAGVLALLARRPLVRWGVNLFHWGAALAILPWVWVWWTDGRPPSPTLAFLYTAVAWGLLFVATRLQVGQRAWYTTAHLGAVTALLVGVVTGNQLMVGWLLLPLAAFYLTVAWIPRPHEALAFIGVWSGVAGVGLIVEAYSHGTGRSAALAALLAVGLVLTERGLHWLMQQRGGQWRLVWGVYRRPFLYTGWLVSIGAIGLALVRNLVWLGGGVPQQTWSIVALLLLVGLYTLAARLYRQERFGWLAAVLILAPWTLLIGRGWYVWPPPRLEWYGLNWMVLVLALLAIAILLQWRLGPGWWSRPLLVVAHLLAPAALLWAYRDVSASVATVGLGLVFYGMAVWMDAHFREKTEPPSERFLYPLLFLLPLWASYLLVWGWPGVTVTAVGLLTLAFSLPLLAAARRLSGRIPGYRLPFYIMAYGTAVVGTLLVAGDRPVLIGALLFDTALAVLSVWLFREPRWWYPGAVTFPLAGAFLLSELGVYQDYAAGWLFIGLSGLYLALAWLLVRRSLAVYAPPLLVMLFVWSIIGLILSDETRMGQFVGYGLAACIWAATAVWQRWPVVYHVAVAFTAISYLAALDLLGVRNEYVGLALWPGILAALALARWLDAHWGTEPDLIETEKMGRLHMIATLWQSSGPFHFLQWWGWSLYVVALAGVIASARLAITSAGWWLWVLAAGTAVCTYYLFRFRRQVWLLLAWGWLQLTWLAVIRWFGWNDMPGQVALAFLPMTVLTAVVALTLQRVGGESPCFLGSRDGWSRPLYLLLLLNVAFGQALAVVAGGAGTAVTLTHVLLLAVLATVWLDNLLALVTLSLGVLALAQWMVWLHIPFPQSLPFFALLALVYGVPGGWLRLRQYKSVHPTRNLPVTPTLPYVWAWPLYLGGWLLSVAALVVAFNDFLASFILFDWIVDLGTPVADIQAWLLTLALSGLFFLTAALVERWRWLGYGAVLLLLGAWSGWLYFLSGRQELQLYAIPTGFYLLGVGWAEWNWGSRGLARWIDRAALLLLFGSAFWQSFGPYGGVYALVMIGEGLLVAWFGSMRRLRRLLYGGMGGVITAVTGQLVEPLLAANTYVLLLLGAFLVAVGIALERRLDKVRGFSKEVRALLEHWE
ncbi:MAG: hypothetical protein HND44_20515 [Chloroflexi bacterium]|nr:hypothetical protein [Ardenticatenaceae bacterium]MBL1130831.1 hypothetical protein [Chloroflexota bacterium]NOG36928.1 hypothetical protein [Chloroflexota bacterium]GIK57155.1 MAG: hypothetical protein BroJett015_28180 [Chloroflexota bacterium]